MTIKAENDPRYSRRFLLMGVAAIGFALWFLYDGAITYPNQRERALAYEELQKENADDPVAFRDRWHETAAKNSWPTSYPGEPKTENDITLQFVMAGIVTVVAALLLSIPLRSRGRWIEASDSGITSSWGENFHYDQVRELNKRQWRSKGIAKVTYDDGGRKRRFVIDDYKFDRYPTDDILFQLEQHIDPGLITGGPPEPVADDATAQVGESTTQQTRHSE
jgi:hypothetical protein